NDIHFASQKSAYSCLKRGGLRSPLLSPPKTKVKSMPISLRKTAQIQARKPVLFLQKKDTKKTAQKNRKFAVRKSAF
ncbi:hypothetical protein, partial [Lactiplantibacillus plajomi]|uniref:hypothetical protein n=1 Tax=Lactiplantibacillus plajomi TaxID=1457217 RepID=UPI001CDBDF0A